MHHRDPSVGLTENLKELMMDRMGERFVDRLLHARAALGGSGSGAGAALPLRDCLKRDKVEAATKKQRVAW